MISPLSLAASTFLCSEDVAILATVFGSPTSTTPSDSLKFCAGPSSSAPPVPPVWSPEQISRCETTSNLLVLFNTYLEVYGPEKRGELKEFFGATMKKYQETKVIPSGKDKAFPIFSHFLLKAGPTINLLLPNLHLYDPRNNLKFLSRLKVIGHTPEILYIRGFFTDIIRIFGLDFSYFTNSDPTEV